MIDCHNHILPSIDDGAKDIDMAVAMAEVAIECGISHIICTPHNLNGVFTNSRSTILAAVAALQRTLDERALPLRLLPGSELHLVPEVLAQLDNQSAMTYADLGKSVLIELPKRTVPRGTIEIMQGIKGRGITPVLAHPERNSTLCRNPHELRHWLDAGCQVQLTAQSVSGDFGNDIQSICEQWLGAGCIHLIASDAHRPRGRKPDLSAARDWVGDRFGDMVRDLLFNENPNRLISGRPLLNVPVLTKPMKSSPPLWQRLKNTLRR